MLELAKILAIVDPVITIMTKMAFIFFAYKGIQVMNVYINKNNKGD
ncbi:hypothetical protein K144313037_14220 [Clostridium tetani]|uniref:Uncharacterized protein n=1 Tax=Clostridium tetani TaxID=1513 RepID=A0ABC8EEN7_CLOTA|nr:hypothetical protein [Clostridium tetani]WFN60952.1 hypothetical protein PAA20_08385 [Clostridium tetani]SJZ49010.1 hypothetical protein SAMN02745112_00376 [Clostridium tetani]SUY56094.1 Uncharacterised protein [Clostridium tetani]SUY66697.1 Uncharacterised protein [Clostridium tetani]BDR64604.1 hypothetical protein K134307016_15380 [Clostridium tetani]